MKHESNQRPLQGQWRQTLSLDSSGVSYGEYLAWVPSSITEILSKRGYNLAGGYECWWSTLEFDCCGSGNEDAWISTRLLRPPPLHLLRPGLHLNV
mmetsp:Transcript_159/g.392  ORF Transcript_159/g.392 Transcript_159/m.392 type:complete len:96 (-) Transcript_159:181-468(-)